MQKETNVFISYAREDSAIAKKLYNDIKREGVTIWIDIENILPGQEWMLEVEKAINDCRYFISILSKNSTSKIGTVQKELKIALKKFDEFIPSEIFIIPVRIDNCKIPYKSLANLQYVDLFPSYEKGLYEILRVIAPDPLKGEIITNSFGMEFVYIPKGNFIMGSPDDEVDRPNDKSLPNEETLHHVTLTKGFYIQKTPVIQEQWLEIMGSNPSHFYNDYNDYNELKCPVENISFYDAHNFTTTLNKIENTDKYRLPTEAEWEYFCRDGSNSLYCYGSDYNKLNQYAWYNKNSDNRTHAVGQLEPNSLGLYDIHGNVWEWCLDYYSEYYPYAQINPAGPPEPSFLSINEDGFGGAWRVIRGGCFKSERNELRCASRGRSSPSNSKNIGFRCIRKR